MISESFESLSMDCFKQDGAGSLGLVMENRPRNWGFMGHGSLENVIEVV